jgi:hypothetical protein
MIGFAVGENVLPSGSSVSPSAKTFCRLDDRFRRRRKRFAAWMIDFAVGVNNFPSILEKIGKDCEE